MNKRRRYLAKRRRYARKHPSKPSFLFARDAFRLAMQVLDNERVQRRYNEFIIGTVQR